MSIEGIRGSLPARQTNTIRKQFALNVPNAIVDENTIVKIETGNNRAENLCGFNQVDKKFSTLTPEIIRMSFKPQINIDPDKITPEYAKQTNATWGKAKGQTIDDLNAV